MGQENVFIDSSLYPISKNLSFNVKHFSYIICFLSIFFFSVGLMKKKYGINFPFCFNVIKKKINEKKNRQ